MTRAETPRDADSIIAAWLDDGPTNLPEPTRRAISVATRTTPRQRRPAWASWRTPSMHASTRMTVAAVAVAAIAIGGLYLIRPGGQVAGPSPAIPSSAPSASPTPPATVTVDQGPEAGYSIQIPATWHYRSYPHGLFFSAEAPITTAAMWVGSATDGDYTIDISGAPGGSPFKLSGKTVDALLASVDSVYRAIASAEGSGAREVTIDGERAWVTEHEITGPSNLWIDAVVIHGGRAYNLTMDAPPEHGPELRAAFDDVMASIRWAD
jgi:hypothetical protein